MKNIALVLSIALSTLAAPAFAQTSPTNTLLSDSLTSIANALGDSNGHLTTTNAAGATQILAYGARRFIVYTAGASISSSDTIVFCVEDAAGGLSSCQAPGSTAGYHCENDCNGTDCDGWCECSTVFDCVAMALTACTEVPSCDGSGCACTNN